MMFNSIRRVANFKKAYFFLFSVCCIFAQQAQAQTTITTTIGSTGYTGTNSSGTGSAITFVIDNTSAAPIFLTDVGDWTSSTDNGSVYTLYYSATSLSGAPATAFPAAGWTQVASNTVTIPSAALSVNNVITGMNFLIPAGVQYRFALFTTGTRRYSGTGVGTASPNTFTAAGINLYTGDYQIAGQYVGYGYTNNPRFFTGSITFIPATPCTGTPTTGNTVITNTCPTLLGLDGLTMAGQLSIQWQQKNTCDTAWTNIPGATNINYSVASVNTPTDFRARVLCTNSGMSSLSNPLTIKSLAPCYCASSATNVDYNEIVSVTVGTMTNVSNCLSTGGPGSALNMYSDYRAIRPPTLLGRGTTVPFTVTTGNCNNNSSTTNGLAIFIDFNRDGDFLDAGEKVYASPTNISAPGTFTGTFTVPAGASEGLSGMRIVNVYNTTGTSISSCGSYTYGETEDYLVSIEDIPSVTGMGSFCSGDTVVLVGSAPAGVSNPQFLWNGPNGFTSTNPTLTFNGIQSNQSGYYSLRILSPFCSNGPMDTSGAFVALVGVTPSPPPPHVAPVIVYCENDDFDTIPIYGQNLKWYPVPQGGVPLTTAPVINTSVLATYVYYVSQTIGSCESPRAPLTISVAPKPAPPQVESPVQYCQGVPPEPLSAIGQNVRWYSVPTGGVGTLIAPTPNTNGQGTYTWYATQTIDGCESERIPVVVNVSYLPNAVITVSRDYVCQYDTLTLGYYGNAADTIDYTWTLPEGATYISGSGQGPLVIRFDSAGIKTVRLVVDNRGCVGPEATTDILVALAPVTTIQMQNDACIDETINLSLIYETADIEDYQWDFNGGEVVYGSFPKGPFGVRWNNSGLKLASLVTDNKGCISKPSTDTVRIHDRPDARITASTNNICAGDSVLFSAAYEFGSSYQWLPPKYFGTQHDHEIWGTVNYTGFVTLNVTSRYNCIGTDSIFMNARPCCEVYFPTAFTPNNDGKNDIFRMLTMTKNQDAKTRAHEIAVFRIQNRWGQTVFETADETLGWDGTYNGEPQDMGSYYYYVKYKCSDGNYYESKGELTLIR